MTLEILEYWTKVCSELVKRKHGSIVPDCHPASEGLADFLNQKGISAVVLKVQVMLPMSACFDHSVVLAQSRYILDPTFGQFREEIPDCPDYLVFEEQGMLEINRKYAAGESNSIGRIRVGKSEVAYFSGDSNLKDRLMGYLASAG